MAAPDEFAGEYQALADPESAAAPGEAKRFKQILKHAATAAGDSQTTGNKEANCSRAISLLCIISQKDKSVSADAFGTACLSSML